MVVRRRTRASIESGGARRVTSLDDRIDLGQGPATELRGQSFGGATGLPEKEPGFVDFRLRYHPAIYYPDPILLGGQLGRGREPAYQWRGIGRASRLLGGY